MLGKAKFGIASALIFAIAAAPALACLFYLAQNATHRCCPQEKPHTAVVARCCVYSPAVTARSVDVPVPTMGAAIIAIGPAELASDVEPLVIANLGTSPPGCSSILRI